jgi:hypothetical protein
VNDFNLFSFALVDYDRDGDIDIIGNGAEGPPQVYENQVAAGKKSIGFRFTFPEGNQLGVNAKIVIEDSAGQRQIREIKAGGGYLSFDGPEAYFGLGEADSVREVRIVGPTGKTWVLSQNFPAQQFYHLALKP